MTLSHRISSIRAFVLKRKLLSLIALIVVAGSVYGFSHSTTAETLVQAERGDVEEEVLVTGKVKSSAVVDLGFEVSGKVARASAAVGSRVREGDTLVTLNQTTLLAERSRAMANLEEEIVKFNSTAQTSNATFQSAEDSLRAATRDAYAKSDDAVRNLIDKFYTNPRAYDTMFDLTFKDSTTIYNFNVTDEAKRRLTNERIDIERLLQNWQTSLNSLTDASDPAVYAAQAQKNLESVRNFLDDVALVVNQITSYDYQYEGTVAEYKSTVSSARSEVATSLNNLISAIGKLKNVPVGNTTTGARVYNDVLSAQARIDSLKADLAGIDADLSKTVLHAPITGVVTKMDAKAGEIVTAGTQLVSVIGSSLQVEANVSEVNVGRVKVGDAVSIILDAFPDKVFEGKVSYIDPAETLVDGVATYKVTVTFVAAPTEEVRNGLTANLKISTAKKTDVVKVPAYAIKKKSDTSYVLIKTNDGEEEREVVVGLKGKDGFVEIVSGLLGTEILIVPKP